MPSNSTAWKIIGGSATPPPSSTAATIAITSGCVTTRQVMPRMRTLHHQARGRLEQNQRHRDDRKVDEHVHPDREPGHRRA